ncbi:unnamed protein product (macronuclear) [Paramecium tetraurelia]|uniref:DUF4200 domain-containing protein n=1 Tax=Paramecium tetraurelia TaxID=5888 RepID=A0D1V3_PARTE|nr:uncharacterized protein GSPATT00012545001 [Paramecium tetraurelia]CAK77020.1 unnamed protein product [Paramecium tetraurelia]|eukprot:XP_001444417.1 hypothetical protein (macronuclear) [Paramecium tetraurelia strain d4-2]
MIDNPFQFEKDPKKFTNSLEYDRNAIEEEDDQKQQTRLTQLYIGKSASRYGLLRKLEEQTQAEKLAVERDHVFSQDFKSKSFNVKPDPISCHLKQFNPRMLEKNYQDSLQKGYKIRSILSEKKETLQDFVEKKREICLTNLNILTKKEETNRLEDFIKNEQESLRARKLYFKNDCELVKRFMSEVKSQADQAAILADKEVRRKEEVKVDVARILAQIDRLKLQKSKLQDEYDKLDKYRQFLEKIKQHYKTKFADLEKDITLPQSTSTTKRTLFLTGVNVLESETRSKEQLEQLQFEYKQNKMADTVIEILDAIEEGNLRNMQNQRDAEEEMEQKKREAQHLREILAIHQKENEQRFKVLEKQYVMHQQYQQELKKQEKVDQNKLEFAEGENLDMDKIGKRIIEIYTDVSKKEQDPLIKKLGIDSKMLKFTLNQLEKVVLELSEYKLQFLMKSKQDFMDAEKKINLKKKEQRQTNQKDEEKKKQIIERRRKKEEQMANFYRGRKDMRRNYPAEKVVVEQVVEDNDENDDEKYLQESYELVYVPSQKVDNISSQQQLQQQQ